MYTNSFMMKEALKEEVALDLDIEGWKCSLMCVSGENYGPKDG